MVKFIRLRKFAYVDMNFDIGYVWKSVILVVENVTNCVCNIFCDKDIIWHEHETFVSFYSVLNVARNLYSYKQGLKILLP